MTISEIIENKIAEHEKIHLGIYTDADLVILRPVWRKQLQKTAWGVITNN